MIAHEVEPASIGARKLVVIGAGPAGLTAAHEAIHRGLDCVVLETDGVVGALARTVDYKGFRFDIGGHRFFTKVRAVEDFWKRALPAGSFTICKRLSRIYYKKRFFFYPIRLVDAIVGLGPFESALVLLSYLRAKVRPFRPARNLEQFLCNQFGRRLYGMFFKSYTQRVWGMPCDEIAADWGAQRIRGLSLRVALQNALGAGRRNGSHVVKTLTEEFHYPEHGPGMMWEAVAEQIGAAGGEVSLRTEVRTIRWSGDRVNAVEIERAGSRECIAGSAFISTMPIRDLLERLDPEPPVAVLAAGRRLAYRDFLTVAIVVDAPTLFPDNWIYIHDPDVRVCRIQNFKNWSPSMVCDSAKTCLGFEYFCFEGDGLWNSTDAELIALATRELRELGLARGQEVIDGAVVRARKAYPVYDAGYADALQIIRGFLDTLANLQLIGRNGMHKYNNQDHSMLTAMLAVNNLFGARHDLWQVNADEAYHEERATGDGEDAEVLRSLAATQPRVPRSVVSGTS